MTPHYQKGTILYDQSRYDLAEKEFRKHLSEDPNDESGHVMLAASLSAQSKFKPALKELKIAVGLNPENPYTFFVLAHTHYQQNHFADAKKAIDEAIKLDHWDADYFALRAEIEMAQLKWQAAAATAEEGLGIDPENISCINARARALVVLGKDAEADKGLEEALRLDPNNPMTLSNMGWTKLRRGRPEEAMQHFRDALRIDPMLEWPKEGVVEALKSRNPLYRWILVSSLKTAEIGSHWKASLWMTSIFFPPLRALLLLYVLVIGLANTIFDFMLRLDPLGKQILTPEAKRKNNIGIALTLIITGLVFFAFNDEYSDLKGASMAKKLARASARQDEVEAKKIQKRLLKHTSKLMDQHKYITAEDDLRALERDKSFRYMEPKWKIWLHRSRGFIARHRGREEDAQEHYQKALAVAESSGNTELSKEIKGEIMPASNKAGTDAREMGTTHSPPTNQ